MTAASGNMNTGGSQIGGSFKRRLSKTRSLGRESLVEAEKTGSAEKTAPLYDRKTGKLRTVKKRRRNSEGKLETYDAPQTYLRTDSWYISIAPIENPQVAIAVVVESGGGGSRTAAPIAARVVLKARELGLLGAKYTPKVNTRGSTRRRR